MFTIKINLSLLERLQNIVKLDHSSQRIYSDPEYFAKALKFELFNALDPVEIERLKNMSLGEEPGIVHFEGFPVDELPSGDSAIERCVHKTRISEAIVLAMASLMNCYLYSKKTEQEGRIFHNVSPVKGKEHVVSSVARDPFYYHTEIAYSPVVPRFLMLFCLEGDPVAKTSYFPIKQILADIPESILQTMRKPVFKLSAISGYDMEETICPLIQTTDEGVEIFRFYQFVDRIEGVSSSPSEALEIEECLNFLKNYAQKTFPESGKEPAVGLQPGEALLFNNGFTLNQDHKGVMHGRVGYIQNPNRWLQRGYFFNQTDQSKEKINEGYYRFLLAMITDKKVPLKLASLCLKQALEHSSDFKRVAETKDYSKNQLFLRGVCPNKRDADSSWLKRIAYESECSTNAL